MAKIYCGDQPNTNTAIVNGVLTTADATLLNSIPHTGATNYVFSDYFTIPFRGQIVSFRPGVTYPIDSALYTALTAASAPMVAA